MKITFKEHGTGASAELVSQAGRGVGVWFGPFGVSDDFTRVIDRKLPVGADAAVLRAMRNESGALRFSAHFIAGTPAAAAILALTLRGSLPKGNGALSVDAGAGAYTVLSDCAIARGGSADIIGAYIRADYTIEY